jgi:SAM-dependent MidA family methyltransferase
MVPKWLRDELDARGGVLSFERFMALALHHPEHGYYARRIATVGARGDFATTATLSPVLGRAIAAWVRSQPQLLPIIEVGPGDGSLARALRASLPWSTRVRLDHHLVETSAPLAAEQQKLLGRRARWHPDMRAALAACGGRALIYHNELVDAFPVARWERRAGAWHELGVMVTPAGCLAETLIAPGTPDTLAAAWPAAKGQVIESHASYRAWLTSWRPHWREGSMLTIDYGAGDRGLLHRRPRGTLRGFLLHERLEGAAIYQNPGRQDLTADVNFADLVRWGEALGLATVRLISQTEFLAPHARSATDAALTDPRGAGGAFMVLEQRPLPG